MKMMRSFICISRGIGVLLVLLGPVISCAAHPDLIDQISQITLQLELT